MTADEIVGCYGTRRIKDGVDQCQRRAMCPWGEACLDRSGEEAADRHYHRANISVGHMLFDPNAEEDRDGGEIPAEAEFADETAALGIPDDANAEPDEIRLEGISIPGTEYESVCAALEAVADMYFDAPTAFDTLMYNIFKGKKQSDAARRRGISRQGLNKRILRELGIAQKRNDIQARRDRELEIAKQTYTAKIEQIRDRDAVLHNLSNRDWMIYKLAFVDGCSLDSVAAQLKIGTSTVDRVVRFLREQLNTSGAIKRGRPKKK